MKIAYPFFKNRISLFAESHLRVLKIAHAIFGPIPLWRGIGYWIFPRVPDNPTLYILIDTHNL